MPNPSKGSIVLSNSYGNEKLWTASGCLLDHSHRCHDKVTQNSKAKGHSEHTSAELSDALLLRSYRVSSSCLRLVLLRRSTPPFTCEARPGWGPTEEARCCRFYLHFNSISNQAQLMAFSQSSYISPQQSVATSAFIPVLQETVFPSSNHKTKTTNKKWKTIENMPTHNPINSSQ